MSLLDNIRSVVFLSSLEIDKIIGTFEGSFDIAAASSGTGISTATANITTGINGPTFFVGIYSIDGGTTWNDFTNKQLVLPPGILFPYFELFGRSTANNMAIVANNLYNYNTSSSSAYTILYKVALIATPTQGIITPKPVKNKVYFNVKYNYQKIQKTDVQPVSIGSLGTQTFISTHNLGYVPKIRTYLFRSSNNSIIQLATDTSGSAEVAIGTVNTTVTLNAPLGGLSGNLYIKSYYDN